MDWLKRLGAIEKKPAQTHLGERPKRRPTLA
jgi:hypothetical protein